MTQWLWATRLSGEVKNCASGERRRKENTGVETFESSCKGNNYLIFQVQRELLHEKFPRSEKNYFYINFWVGCRCYHQWHLIFVKAGPIQEAPVSQFIQLLFFFFRCYLLLGVSYQEHSYRGRLSKSSALSQPLTYLLLKTSTKYVCIEEN